MKLLLNDFGRYSFVAQLSRELARRGMAVDYSYCAALTTTPEGAVKRRQSDPETLDFKPIRLSHPLDKYSLFKRRQQEIEYGKMTAELVRSSRPDVVLSANTPIDAQARVWKAANTVGAKKIFWLQDIIGIAAERILSAKLPILGRLVGQVLRTPREETIARC